LPSKSAVFLFSFQILILDEATANVDPKTDAQIQQTIRTSFAECTVLTIAHRLDTIVDADRVLVLDAGRVVEFDEPISLMRDEDGVFSSMCRATGKESATKLKQMAQKAANQRSVMNAKSVPPAKLTATV
jgi:ABC-type multidrug transport system fused ATPase/permease subunit